MPAALSLVISCNFSRTSTSKVPPASENSRVLTDTAYTRSSVKNNMEYLASDELKGRATGTEGIEKAAMHIEDAFQKASLKPYFETYRDSFRVRDRSGYNLVGLLEGNDPELKKEYIIIGAHYDHIGYGKPVEGDSIANGANDNAAGTVAVLELARILSMLSENKRSLLFVLFSAEEMGLQGAKHLAKRMKSEDIKIYTMVNFEMIGVPMKDRNYLAYLTGYDRSNLAQKFNLYSGNGVLGYLPQAQEYNLFQRSDNYPFYQELNIPAHTISTFDFTNYDYYHHVFDETQRMDYSHMAKLIHKVVPGLLTMTNTAEQEIELKE